MITYTTEILAFIVVASYSIGILIHSWNLTVYGERSLVWTLTKTAVRGIFWPISIIQIRYSKKSLE